MRTEWPCLEVFKEAGKSFGMTETVDFNTGNNEGIGYYDVSQREGWRLSSYAAFIKPNLSRSNLRVVSDATVSTLLVDEQAKTKTAGSTAAGTSAESSSLRCRGVAVLHEGKLKEFYATKDVILSAGSIGSVQILERSGIGRKDVLDRLDIPVVKQLEGVGENLQDHLQLRVVYKVSGLATLNTLYDSMLGKVRYDWLLAGTCQLC